MDTEDRLAVGEERPAHNFTVGAGGSFSTLLCPVCGGDYTHVRSAHTAFGVDEYESGTPYKGTRARGVRKGWRRDALVIGVWGECGHAFQVVFQQHKGNTFLFVRRLPDPSSHDDREYAG